MPYRDKIFPQKSHTRNQLDLFPANFSSNIQNDLLDRLGISSRRRYWFRPKTAGFTKKVEIGCIFRFLRIFRSIVRLSLSLPKITMILQLIINFEIRVRNKNKSSLLLNTEYVRNWTKEFVKKNILTTRCGGAQFNMHIFEFGRIVKKLKICWNPYSVFVLFVIMNHHIRFVAFIMIIVPMFVFPQNPMKGKDKIITIVSAVNKKMKMLLDTLK